MHLFLIICSCLAIANCDSGRLLGPPPYWPSNQEKEGALFLTDYIRRNETAEGREKSSVKFFKERYSVDAHSGYITTNFENTSHLFFLYMNASYSPAEAPIILWLYGGPGTSALTAQFVYNGPVGVKADRYGTPEFVKRRDTFQKHYHVIYLDAPAGSGFSFANSTEGFDSTSVKVAHSIENFLLQFFELFPELKGNKLFVNGESYAARYAVALAAKRSRSVPLSGIMLGIPFLGKVVEALNPTSFLRCVGMLDENGVKQFDEKFEIIRNLFLQKQYLYALVVISETILNSENQDKQTLYTNLTGFKWHGSALRSDMPPEIYFYYVLTNTSDFRKEIHVGEIRREAQRLTVVSSLAAGDFSTDMADTFAGVLNSSLPVLMYAARMDTVAPSPTFHSHFNKLKWFGADEFRNASRQAFFTNVTYPSRQTLRYYKKEHGNVTLVDIDAAGHYVSIDKPKVVLEVINKFIKKYANPAGKMVRRQSN